MTRLTQEDVPVEVHPLQLLVISLLHQVREVGPQAGVDGPSHLCRQGPQFLLMVPQGLPIELHMQGGQRSWACQTDTGGSKTYSTNLFQSKCGGLNWFLMGLKGIFKGAKKSKHQIKKNKSSYYSSLDDSHSLRICWHLFLGRQLQRIQPSQEAALTSSMVAGDRTPLSSTPGFLSYQVDFAFTWDRTFLGWSVFYGVGFFKKTQLVVALQDWIWAPLL